MPTYEDTLLAGKLTDDQLDSIVAEFVANSDIGVIAAKLDLPRALVLQAFEDGTLQDRALAAKKGAAVVRFMGTAIDQLLVVVENPLALSSGSEKLTAIKLLRDLLGLRPVERLNPKPPRSKKEPAGKHKVGAFEAALTSEDEDEE